MSREGIIASILALLFHGLLLFGFHFETAPTPLAMADTSVEVSLVDGAPAPASAPATAEPPPAEPPAEPPPSVPPPPQPVPPPEPEPAPPIPEPSHETPPAPVPPPPPRPAPPHREPTHPAHPSTSHAAARAAAAAAAAEGPASAAVGTGGTGRSGVRARYNPKPPYPPEAERLHQDGRVELSVQVGADGRVISVTVTHSSGVASLDSAAVEGVRRWTFEPARVAGLAVAGRADVPVVFALNHR